MNAAVKDSKLPLFRRITRREATDTGMAIVLLCLLGGWVTDHRGWVYASGICLVLNMTWPTIFSLAAKLWLTLSHLMGAVMSKVVLGGIFFLVLTPLSLIRQLLGHDMMLLRQLKTSGSAFVSRDHQYHPSEIERPY